MQTERAVQACQEKSTVVIMSSTSMCVVRSAALTCAEQQLAVC